MKNLSNFNLNTDKSSKGFQDLDNEASKTAELEAQLAKYKRLGRPKSENPPTKQMTVYFSDEEMVFIEKQAKQGNITKNQVIRKLIQDSMKIV